MFSSTTYRGVNTGLLIFLILTGTTLECGPGRGAGRRKRPGKLIPLVFKQHVPNVSENTLGASGVAEGRITRNDPKFKQLVRNENPHIIFKDEEGNGSDRIMSKRCKDKLNTLAVRVMNTWPGVKLLVTEAWDEEGHHAKDSLHYEGRAVDITTSDRDRTKYGMLSRLAVEAGFDWVYYESRGHIHCSVKSESSAAIKIGGCFSGTGSVTTETEGQIPISELKVGQKVLSMTNEGKLDFSEVISFLDRDEMRHGVFYKLVTVERTITLTEKHLIYTSNINNSAIDSYKAIYADRVQIGQYVLIAEHLALKPSKIIDIRIIKQKGVFAPLTTQGTIIVDGVAASCYAVVNSINIAHSVFAPVRALHSLSKYISVLSWTFSDTSPTNGVHWYADLLYNIGTLLLNKDMLYVA